MVHQTREKSHNRNHPPETRVDPFISQMKSPEWKPFFLIENSPEFLVPVLNPEQLLNFSVTLDNFELEEIFWYFSLKHYLNLPITRDNYELGDMLLTYIRKHNELIAFANIFAHPSKTSKPVPVHELKKEQFRSVAVTQFDLQSTFYALLILRYIGRCQETLQLLDGEVAEGITHYLHYLIQHPELEAHLSPGKLLFLVLSLTKILHPDKHEWASFSQMPWKSQMIQLFQKSPANGFDAVFRLLCWRFVGDNSRLTEDHILKFHQYRKPTGGFTFKNSAFPDLNSTFWIAYLLETYKWFLPYQTGPIYTYIISNLKKYKNLDVQDQHESMPSLAKNLVLLAILFESIMSDTEELIFSNMEQDKLLNFEILSRQGGFLGAEREIVAFLNQRFQFKLEIVDNEIRFRRFLNQLTPLEEKIAIELRSLVQRYKKSDLSLFRKTYNSHVSRRNRIGIDFCIQLLKRMKQELFFEGDIVKKNRFLLATKYFFRRDSYIDKIIITDRPVEWNAIQSEKRRMSEVIRDIYSMTHEMQVATEHIMNEIESMIIAGIDPEFIENRLKFNIKKALFDAMFFKKTIENFQSEFVLLNPTGFLKRYLENWTTVYTHLQQNFSNLSRILHIKIDQLKQEQFQHKLVVELEAEIHEKIGFYGKKFDEYETKFRTLLLESYSRKLVKELHNKLIAIHNGLKKADTEVQDFSLKIDSKKDQVAQFRKKVISEWISQKDEFKTVINYYLEGFTNWNQLMGNIDTHHEQALQEIDEVEMEILQRLNQNEHEVAKEMLDQKFPQIVKQNEKYLKRMKRKITRLYRKNRKLAPLYKNLKSEAVVQMILIQKIINHKRNEFKTTIQLDLEMHLSEEFIELVNQCINELREAVIDLESSLSMELQTGFTLQQDRFMEKYEKIPDMLHKHEEKIEDHYQNVHQKLDEDQDEIELHYTKWFDFKDELVQDIQNLHQKYEDEHMVHFCLKYAREHNTNFIKIEFLAKLREIKEETVISQLQEIIQHNKLNGALRGEPLTLEIHNSDWRDWKRLKQLNSSLSREIITDYKKIQHYFSKSLQKGNLIEQRDQIEHLTQNLKQHLQGTLESYDAVVEKMNMLNPIIREASQNFNNKITDLQKKLENITTSMKYGDKLHKEMTNLYQETENRIDSTLHDMSQTFSRRKKFDSNSNKKWLEEQKEALLQMIKTADEELETLLLDNVPEYVQVVFQQLESEYNQKIKIKQEQIDQFCQDLEDNFLQAETQALHDKMDQFLNKFEKKRSNLVHKLDLDIQNRIRRKEFLVAARTLEKRQKILQSMIKKWEKQFKKLLKKYSAVSNRFKIKHVPHFLSLWSDFKQEFQETTIESQKLALRTELILQFTRFTMASIKGNFVPLKFYVDDLGIKHEVVKHTLMSLITDGALSGKLDITYDIYFEGSETPDREVIASLEIIRKTNVKFYIKLERLKNIFSLLAPIIATLGSIISMVWYLTRFSSNLFIILSPILLILAIFLIFWIRRGKKVYSSLTSDQSIVELHKNLDNLDNLD